MSTIDSYYFLTPSYPVEQEPKQKTQRRISVPPARTSHISLPPLLQPQCSPSCSLYTQWVLPLSGAARIAYGFGTQACVHGSWMSQCLRWCLIPSLRQQSMINNYTQPRVARVDAVEISWLCQRNSAFQFLCHKRVIIFIYSWITSWQEDRKSKNKAQLTNIIAVIFILSVSIPLRLWPKWA